MWASRADADIVRGSEGGDPSSVVFDAVQRAEAKGHAVVLADTAGRLHNKVNLIEELKKIRRVADRPPGRVVEVLLVLDATTGQNGLAQAKVFLEAVDVSGRGADQARRHGQGRHRGGHPAGARPPGEAGRVWARASTTWSTSTPAAFVDALF